MDLHELKLRRMAGQYLLSPTDPLTAARELCGFQAQFMTNALHSLRLRCGGGYGVSGLVKNWTVRGTVHLFAESDLLLFKFRSPDRPFRSEEWRGYVHHVTREWTLAPERQRRFARAIVEVLRDAPLTREELKAVCRAGG